MMGQRATVTLVLVMTLGAACRGRGDANDNAPVTIPTDDELRRQGRLELGDSHVVAEIATPKVPGRIIYEPPEDLSMTNAIRMRPDLVRGDTTRRDTSALRTRRDTTAGDAAADTSGGAARPKRP